MKDLELEEKLKLVKKESSLLGEGIDKTKPDLKEAVDSLEIEIESLNVVLQE